MYLIYVPFIILLLVGATNIVTNLSNNEEEEIRLLR